MTIESSIPNTVAGLLPLNILHEPVGVPFTRISAHLYPRPPSQTLSACAWVMRIVVGICGFAAGAMPSSSSCFALIFLHIPRIVPVRS